jgi:ABC-type lipoprotein release transport system permease subunit
VGDIHAGTYAYALLFSMITAMIAVNSQTWKATRANPADSLRRE